jgi:hypothetical protein
MDRVLARNGHRQLAIKPILQAPRANDGPRADLEAMHRDVAAGKTSRVRSNPVIVNWLAVRAVLCCKQR